MLQFVPVEASLEDNAPGYHDTKSQLGPLCWKCSGQGVVIAKKSTITCKVCHGKQRLPIKQQVLSSRETNGTVTIQPYPSGWSPIEPLSAYGNVDQTEFPELLKLKLGEQLCVLVGNWRIYQSIGGHRWTTDDIVTAWVAGNVARRGNTVTRTLDLGCGNGSVLMMVAWQYAHAQCIGIEARSEAVALARRSITYNIGDCDSRVTIRNCDFRTLIPDPILRENSGIGQTESMYSAEYEESTERPSTALAEVKFDLITGTPPYFRVDFELNKDDKSSTNPENTLANEAKDPSSSVSVLDNSTSTEKTTVVARAVIREGGMPTCKESAPARCEFRGGIEAYCAAAVASLAPTGTFVVCENFANHERVLKAIKQANLCLNSVQRVVGKIGKPPLFCVYTCQHNHSVVHKTTCVDNNEKDEQHGEESGVHYESDLVVRDSDGAWTPEYAALLRDMNYPVASLHPSGLY